MIFVGQFTFTRYVGTLQLPQTSFRQLKRISPSDYLQRIRMLAWLLGVWWNFKADGGRFGTRLSKLGLFNSFQVDWYWL